LETVADLHEVPCPLCGGHDVVAVLRDTTARRIATAATVACTSRDHARFGQIVACRACGIRFRSPREDDETILSYYSAVEDPVYVEQEAARRLTFDRALVELEARVPIRGPLLDVGCYTGVFLDVAAARGWDVRGIEPSRWAAGVAIGKGHRVHHGTLEGAPDGFRDFAVITMWDTLEHYADPVRELRRARAVAARGGYLVLTTMNIDSTVVRLLGRRWPWYMRMHLAYFTPGTVRAALAAAGWEMVGRSGYAHVVSWDYLLLKLGVYLPAASRRLRAAARALGNAERTISVDLGDFMTVYARATA